MDEQTASSYRWCRELCSRSGSSFCWTFVLLPRSQRMAMDALYAFARITDDLSDDATDGNNSAGHGADNKREALNQWLHRTESLQSPQWSSMTEPRSPMDLDRVWPALRHAAIEYSIPNKWLADIVRGVMMDLDHRPPNDWQEADHYCYHVASAVGLACTRIWKAREDMPQQAAIDCGIAFQLTNILRDVAADAQMGRIYIPLSELNRFGIDRDRWLAGSPNGQWRDAIQAVAQRAESLYASGWQTIDYLPPPSRRLFSLMWRYYHALLAEVLRNLDQLWQPKRVRIRGGTRLRIAAQHFIAPWYWSLPKPV